MSWHNESVRHGLSARGVKTKAYWRNKYPELVKPFPGENPSITENYVRFRQADPKKFTKFRTKPVSAGKQVILGKNRVTGEFELQSVLISKNVRRDSMAFRVVQDGNQYYVKNFDTFNSVPSYNPRAKHTVIYDDKGNVAFESATAGG